MNNISNTEQKRFITKTMQRKIFSKFDMKSSFWQMQIDQKDRYKIAFIVSFG